MTATAAIMLFMILVGINMWYFASAQNYCYQTDRNPTRNFTTKTAYNIARENNNMKVAFEDCKPVYVHGVIRHGTKKMATYDEPFKNREAMTTLMKNVVQKHNNEKRGTLCEEDVQALKKKLESDDDDIPDSSDVELTAQGKTDMKFIAGVMKTKFQNLFDFKQSDKYLFKSSSTERTLESARIFMEEFFEPPLTHSQSNSMLDIDEPLLGINFETVGKVMKNLDEEYREFMKSDVMKNLIKKVCDRLGLSENEITLDNLKTVYEKCAFEFAWNPTVENKPAVCALLTPDQWKVLEYMFDLKFYYHRGYGKNPQKRILGLQMIKNIMDMLKSYQEAEKKNETHKYLASFYFTHTEVILPLATELGFYRDENPLRFKNFANEKENRKWQTWKISPYAANIIVVLHECSTSVEGDKHQLKVSFYNNERLMNIEGCEDGLCSLDYVLDKFKNEDRLVKTGEKPVAETSGAVEE